MMNPIDVSFVETLPVLKELGPDGAAIVATGVTVQVILSAIRMAVTGSKEKGPKADHWYNKTMGRMGPLVNLALGWGIASATTVPVHIGLLGGGLSQWTYAFFNKSIRPGASKLGTVIRNGTGSG